MIVTVIVLSGCPRASWYVEPDKPADFAVTDKCLRAANTLNGVLGVVKLEFDYIDDSFARYLIETTYGVANLDIIYSNSELPNVRLYLSGDERFPPKNEAQAKNYLENLIRQIEITCSD
ncbi:MAG: hypothetical protein HKP09_02435 [Enterobacterales bacterium]|nr:hypothetical protein [Enterobacterales bacterium]